MDEFKEKFRTDVAITFDMVDKELSNCFDNLLFKDNSTVLYGEISQNDKINGLVKQIKKYQLNPRIQMKSLMAFGLHQVMLHQLH